MSKSFIEEFKKEFSFLEEYGFVFSIDPCNPNRPCYKNNYGEIIYWIDSNSGIGWNTEIYYQINGWKYSIDVEEEYRKIFRKNTFLKDKIKILTEKSSNSQSVVTQLNQEELEELKEFENKILQEISDEDLEEEISEERKQALLEKGLEQRNQEELKKALVKECLQESLRCLWR